MEVDKALDIDQSLDTFVQEEKARRNKQRRKQRSSLTNKNRRPGAPSGPGPVRSAATATTKPKKDLFPEQVGEGKIVVSNLPSDVTQSQVEVRNPTSIHLYSNTSSYSCILSRISSSKVSAPSRAVHLHSTTKEGLPVLLPLFSAITFMLAMHTINSMAV